jgi:hypothetical protein
MLCPRPVASCRRRQHGELLHMGGQVHPGKIRHDFRTKPLDLIPERPEEVVRLETVLRTKPKLADFW